MIEVTDEMLEAGLDATYGPTTWRREFSKGVQAQEKTRLAAAYRAMRTLEPKVERPVKASAYHYPPDGIAPELDTYLVQQADRLDALQALVLVLAARSPGYPPGDATLTRLIAELENAR